MKPSFTHDLIIIGSDPASIDIATFCTQAGLHVAWVKKETNNFHISLQALLHVAQTVRCSDEALKYTGGVPEQISWSKVLEYVEKVQRYNTDKQEKELRGVDVYIGDAKFNDRYTISVEDMVISAPKLVVATGSKPKLISLVAYDKSIPIYTNENIFSLESLPKHLVVVGTGVLGLELGQAFSYLGCPVTFLSKHDRILPREDGRISEVLYKKMVSEGSNFLFNVALEKIVAGQAWIRNKDGRLNAIETDAILVCIGREVKNQGLQLEAAAISHSPRGISVTNTLQTTQKHIYAFGTCAEVPKHPYSSEVQAKIILHNFFNPFKKGCKRENVSYVISTNPEIATFGVKGEEEHTQPFETDDKAMSDEYRKALAIYHTTKGKIVGGSIVAPNAGEMIQELLYKPSLWSLFTKTYPLKTGSRINQSVAKNYLYKHKLQGKRKDLLKYLYRI